MIIEPSRRRFLHVLTGIIAAPAVIKASALMKVVAPPATLMYCVDSLSIKHQDYFSHLKIINYVVPKHLIYVNYKFMLKNCDLYKLVSDPLAADESAES